MTEGDGSGEKKWLFTLSGSALIFNVLRQQARALTPETMHSLLLYFLLPVCTHLQLQATHHHKLTFALLPLGTPIKQVCDKEARSANQTVLTLLHVAVYPPPHHFPSSRSFTSLSSPALNGFPCHRISSSAPIYPNNIMKVSPNNVKLNRTTLSFSPKKKRVDVSALSSRNYLAWGTHYK